jgi:DNA-binding transcriptional regulator YhcF (GntR family)
MACASLTNSLTKFSMVKSLITTKRAYEDLEKDGFVTTIRGKGTFVKEQDRSSSSDISMACASLTNSLTKFSMVKNCFSFKIELSCSLTTMRELAKDLQVSLITTKRAYEDLEKDGFVTTIRGKGTFVKEQDLTCKSLASSLIDGKCSPGAT